MSNDMQKKRNASISPEEENNPSRSGQEEKQEPENREGEYRNVETSVDNPSYFNDDYEVKEEDKISREEAETEGENNVPARRRGDV